MNATGDKRRGKVYETMDTNVYNTGFSELGYSADIFIRAFVSFVVGSFVSSRRFDDLFIDSFGRYTF